ncbi:hypothetical protein IAQ61_003934 [Plenodomus lingam]|uniref:Predicted protein n=1 Tax=Leptosphaeria maculans (strain JN3 / isolate v23.1.3 / race Av1-4-5-6-7-8) TaxID=985895 RepID=E4ZQQ6_LEPMJ|nr:predicted protein [Plenodomus lingam JN3]KAH9874744.1 hypothetical protein IAQ61_003934 [Plenodomus lingam]CBX94061.1 predicted protein [Plenodomus lingam JN3]
MFPSQDETNAYSIASQRPLAPNTADDQADRIEQSTATLAVLKADIINLLPLYDDAVLFTISCDFIAGFKGHKCKTLHPYQRALAAVYLANPAIRRLYDKFADMQTKMKSPTMNRTPDFSECERMGKVGRLKKWSAERGPEHSGGDDPAPWFLAGTEVQNPGLFPIHRIQNLRHRSPSANIFAMQSWHDVLDNEVMVIAKMINGEYTDIIINDQRHIAALGLDKDPHDRIELKQEIFRIGETFTITACDKRNPKDMNGDFIGELKSARHAYLHWLDARNDVDPHPAPYRTEINILAERLGRQRKDVWDEVNEYWDLEQGEDGQRYWRNRKLYLGEDPRYSGPKSKLPMMWG